MGKSQMVGVRRPSTANQARTLSDRFDMFPVTDPAWLRQGQQALVDELCPPPSPALCFVPVHEAAPRRYRALWCRLRVVRRRRDHKRPKLSLEGLLHTLGIWRDQPVLIGEASARPRCRVIGGAKIVEFGEEPIRQFCRRLRCEKRFDRFRVPGSP